MRLGPFEVVKAFRGCSRLVVKTGPAFFPMIERLFKISARALARVQGSRALSFTGNDPVAAQPFLLRHSRPFVATCAVRRRNWSSLLNIIRPERTPIPSAAFQTARIPSRGMCFLDCLVQRLRRPSCCASAKRRTRIASLFSQHVIRTIKIHEVKGLTHTIKDQVHGRLCSVTCEHIRGRLGSLRGMNWYRPSYEIYDFRACLPLRGLLNYANVR
jgi:hypothetical protein